MSIPVELSVEMKSTGRYIHYAKVVFLQTGKDEWTVSAAKTAKEATDLIAVGFEYVTDIEGFKLFRKRK
ncbi:MAG: hypothetical protein ABSF65_09420 [Candidatus Bathyarchaeia archaeon]|jgi:hypothetical protein